MGDTLSSPAVYKRPVLVTVLGIIIMITSISGLIGAATSAVYAPLMQAVYGGMADLNGFSGEASSVYGGLSQAIGQMVIYFVILAAVGLVINTIGLVGARGLLRSRAWSQPLLIVYAVLCFVESSSSIIVSNLMLNPLFEYMTGLFGRPEMSAGDFGPTFMSFYSGFLRTAIITGAVEGAVLVVIFLVLMNSPKMREHFRVLRDRGV